MLMCSLAAWIVFNVPLGFIHTPPTSCLVYNSSGFFIQVTVNKESKKKEGNCGSGDYD